MLKDFHFASLHEAIKPLILRNGERDPWGNILVRAEAGKTKEAIKNLEKVFEKVNPKFAFSYSFADEQYQKLYASEQTMGKLSNYFAGLSIFICCMGLLGLAIVTAEQRTKEIGIRKVIGASAASLFVLLSKDFFILIIISMCIAFPLAWWAMYEWLTNFAYQADITWWIFALSAALIVSAAIITISYQSIKAVLANPVKSLRAE